MSANDQPNDNFHRLRRELEQSPKRSSSPYFGKGKRASLSDLRKLLRPSVTATTPSFPGVSLAVENDRNGSIELASNHDLYLPTSVRNRNILVVGQIGSGKTEEFIWPMSYADIASTESSWVLFDGKGNALEKITPIVERFRPRTAIQHICFGDSRRSSSTWNPFGDFGVANETQLLDRILSFVSASRHDDERVDKFWDTTSARIIAGVVQRLKERNLPCTPVAIYRILELPRAELLAYLKDGQTLPFASSTASFIESGSHNAETSLAFAQSHLSRFGNPEIAAVTSGDSYSHTQLFQQPTILVVEAPLRHLARIGAVMTVFITTMLRDATAFAATQVDDRLPIPLNIYMDDFPLITGRIPEFPQQLNLLRSAGVSITAAAHSISSIQHCYGTQTGLVLSGFATKIFKSPVDQSDANFAADLSGTTTVDVIDETQVRDSVDDSLFHSSRNTRACSRSLLLPEDVRVSPLHPELGRATTVFLADEHVFQAWFVPSYQQPRVRELLEEARVNASLVVLHPEFSKAEQARRDAISELMAIILQWANESAAQVQEKWNSLLERGFRALEEARTKALAHTPPTPTSQSVAKLTTADKFVPDPEKMRAYHESVEKLKQMAMQQPKPKKHEG